MAKKKRGKVWYARLYWRDKTNRRQSKSKGGFKTKNKASAWYAQTKTLLNDRD